MQSEKKSARAVILAASLLLNFSQKKLPQHELPKLVGLQLGQHEQIVVNNCGKIEGAINEQGHKKLKWEARETPRCLIVDFSWTQTDESKLWKSYQEKNWADQIAYWPRMPETGMAGITAWESVGETGS